MNYTESDLSFEFHDQHWSTLLKFDETRDFQKVQEALLGTKGIDFIGVKDRRSLVLIEVKNFRGHRIQNKPRLVGGMDSLWQEVGQKMRDSIAIIIGGTRNSTNLKDSWKIISGYLVNEKQALHLVLWLEQDMPSNNPQARKKWNRDETYLRRMLKKSLSWLTTRVDVACIDNNPFTDSLTVRYI